MFNVVQPWGRGEKRFETLVPRYADVATEFAAFAARHPPGSLPIYLLDIPYCVTEGRDIPDRNRGYVERYVHYELPAGRQEPFGDDVDLAEVGADLSGGAEAKLDHRMEAEGFTQTLNARHRDRQDQQTKAKRNECRDCRYFEVCDGVWRNYLRRHGWDEFQPVR